MDNSNGWWSYITTRYYYIFSAELRDAMPHKSDRPHMDPRLAERIKRKKAQLDRSRPLPSDTVRRLNDFVHIDMLVLHGIPVLVANLSWRNGKALGGKGCKARTELRMLVHSFIGRKPLLVRME
jgi:hypothetical protein